MLLLIELADMPYFLYSHFFYYRSYLGGRTPGRHRLKGRKGVHKVGLDLRPVSFQVLY